MALLLGVVGIYGVISYSVSQRTREIGIRLALGAPLRDVKRVFVRHGLLMAGIGSVCGLSVALALTRLMKSLLFEVGPADPLTYAAAFRSLDSCGGFWQLLADTTSHKGRREALRAE
jgi:ABC-type antimicrobial peptide transport system permease subunit